jgi:hypothetical protein
MFTDAVVAIDGNEFKAVNSKDNNYTPKKLQFHIARVEKHIENNLQQLDDADKESEGRVDETTIPEKIAWLTNRLSELKALEVAVNNHPDKQLSTTDPDSRLLKTRSDEPTRSGQLCNMGKQTQAALAQDEVTILVDKGYFSSQDIKDTQDAGMIPLVPKGIPQVARRKGYLIDLSLPTMSLEMSVFVQLIRYYPIASPG